MAKEKITKSFLYYIGRCNGKTNVIRNSIELFCKRNKNKVVVKGMVCDNPNLNGDIFPYKELRKIKSGKRS